MGKKRRRDRGLYRRPDGPGGTYYLDFMDRHGNRIRRSLETKSRAEALQRRDRVMRGEVEPKWGVEQRDITAADLWKRYEEWARSRLAASTIAHYEGLWRNFLEHVKPATLGAVTPRQVDVYLRTRQAEGRSAQTCNLTITVLRLLYKFAIEQGLYTGENPASRVKRVKAEEKPAPRFLDKNQIDAVTTQAEAHSEPILLFCGLALFAGLRTKEAVNARWEWVDFLQGTITVQAASDGSFTTKSSRYRSIPLHDRLRAILEPRRQSEGFIINPEKTDNGKWRIRYEPKRAFGTVTVAAGVPWCTPHVLRHTFASQLVMAGVSIYKVSRWLGHSDVSTTQIYAHLSPRDEDINRF